MKKIILLWLLLLGSKAAAQWRTYSDVDPFDGKMKTIIATGYNGTFPYNNPKLVIRQGSKDGLEAYITDAGSLACEEGVVRFSFGNPESVMEFSMSPSIGDDAGFISTNSSSFKIFVKKLKQNSMLYVDFRTRCSQHRFKISLSGSTAALNTIFGAEFDREVIALEKRLAEQDRKRKADLERTRKLKEEFLTKEAELIENIRGAFFPDDADVLIRKITAYYQKGEYDYLTFRTHRIDKNFVYPIIMSKGKEIELSTIPVFRQTFFEEKFPVSYYQSAYYDPHANKVDNWGLNNRTLNKSGGGRIILASNDTQPDDNIIVVRIEVDYIGVVKNALPGIAGSTTSNPELLEKAKKMAENYFFNTDKRAPERQVGYVMIKAW